MARIVGDDGLVIAVDLQQEMLDRLERRARALELEPRIKLHKCESDRIGLEETVDFALAFYVVHEVPDSQELLRQMHGLIKPGGRLLLVEPNIHVSASAYQQTVRLACATGFNPVDTPWIFLSRSTLFGRE